MFSASAKEEKKEEKVEFVVFEDGTLKVNHFLDLCDVSQLTNYTYTSREKEKIIKKRTEYLDPYLKNPIKSKLAIEVAALQISSYLPDEVDELAKTALTAQLNTLICQLIVDADEFFNYLNTTKVDKRIKHTKKFFEGLDALYERLGDLGFYRFLDELYRLQIIDLQKEAAEPEESYLSIITLACSELCRHHAIIEKFMFLEIFAHDVVYKIAQNKGEKIHTVLMQGVKPESIQTFSVYELGVKKKDGTANLAVMGSVLIENPTQAINEKRIPVYIAFSGTWNEVQAKADIEFAPGEESYRQAEDQILANILQALSDYKKICKTELNIDKVTFDLIFCGHSLGGSLAQNCFVSMQRLLLKNINPDLYQSSEEEFRKELRAEVPAYRKPGFLFKSLDDFSISTDDVFKLVLGVKHSSGVADSVKQYSNLIAPLLKNVGLPHEAYFSTSGGDIVQLAGKGNILSDIENNGAYVYFLKIEPPTWRFGAKLFSSIGVTTVVTVAGAVTISAATGFVGGFTVWMATMLYSAKKSYEAHTMKHFQVMKDLHMIPYRLHTTHNADGKTSEYDKKGLQRIEENLNRNSMVVNAITTTVSVLGGAASSTTALIGGYIFRSSSAPATALVSAAAQAATPTEAPGAPMVENSSYFGNMSAYVSSFWNKKADVPVAEPVNVPQVDEFRRG